MVSSPQPSSGGRGGKRANLVCGLLVLFGASADSAAVVRIDFRGIAGRRMLVPALFGIISLQL